MKKLLIVLMGLLLGTSAWAQKQSEGNITAEYLLDLSNLGLFTPGSGQPYSLFNSAVRARYFLHDDLAVRVHLGVNGASQTENYAENADGTGGKGSRVAKTNQVTFGLGVEKHFEGNDRLSPFVGFEFLLQSRSASEKWDKYDGIGYNANYTRTITGQATVNGNTYNKTSSFGAGLYAGFDYYFLENIYVGTEFNLGFTSGKTADVTDEVNVSGTPNKTVTPGGKISGFNTSAVGYLRLGFIIK